jgi:hypothetical protein
VREVRRSWQMGVGKLLQMALGNAAREVQERVSNTASGRGTGVNWYGTPTTRTGLDAARSSTDDHGVSAGRITTTRHTFGWCTTTATMLRWVRGAD